MPTLQAWQIGKVWQFCQTALKNFVAYKVPYFFSVGGTIAKVRQAVRGRSLGTTWWPSRECHRWQQCCSSYPCGNPVISKRLWTNTFVKHNNNKKSERLYKNHVHTKYKLQLSYHFQQRITINIIKQEKENKNWTCCSLQM